MITRAFYLALAAGFLSAFWWWGAVRYTQGYQASQIEVQEARDELARSLGEQQRIMREAAAAIQAAETERDRAIQEALNALPQDSRAIVVSPDALGLLRSIR